MKAATPHASVAVGHKNASHTAKKMEATHMTLHRMAHCVTSPSEPWGVPKAWNWRPKREGKTAKPALKDTFVTSSATPPLRTSDGLVAAGRCAAGRRGMSEGGSLPGGAVPTLRGFFVGSL